MQSTDRILPWIFRHAALLTVLLAMLSGCSKEDTSDRHSRHILLIGSNTRSRDQLDKYLEVIQRIQGVVKVSAIMQNHAVHVWVADGTSDQSILTRLDQAGFQSTVVQSTPWDGTSPPLVTPPVVVPTLQSAEPIK